MKCNKYVHPIPTYPLNFGNKQYIGFYFSIIYSNILLQFDLTHKYEIKCKSHQSSVSLNTNIFLQIRFVFWENVQNF
jgi:hypothetical protein